MGAGTGQRPRQRAEGVRWVSLRLIARPVFAAAGRAAALVARPDMRGQLPAVAMVIPALLDHSHDLVGPAMGTGGAGVDVGHAFLRALLLRLRSAALIGAALTIWPQQGQRSPVAGLSRSFVTLLNAAGGASRFFVTPLPLRLAFLDHVTGSATSSVFGR